MEDEKIRKVTMLDRLHVLLGGPLCNMLASASTPWKTVDVTYEEPHVERVWTEWEGFRVNLHRIHPCEKALFHPHPWPSAMVLCLGTYEMAVGRSLDGSLPVETARVVLSEGSEYEMNDPYGWHWVRPLEKPVMSVMLTGKPWAMPEGFPKHGKGHVHRELDALRTNEILFWFGRMFGGK